MKTESTKDPCLVELELLNICVILGNFKSPGPEELHAGVLKGLADDSVETLHMK